MEIKIQDLVSSIKKDGIESANRESAEIIAKAEKQAEAILSEARSAADAMLENVRKEMDTYKNNAQVSAEQAKRDAMLAFKNEIQKEFEKILKCDICKALNEQALVTLILAAIKDADVSEYAVEVSKVTEHLKQQLAAQIKAGLEIRPSNKIQAGFRLAAKDKSGYFDCSDEEITNMLMPFFRNISL